MERNDVGVRQLLEDGDLVLSRLLVAWTHALHAYLLEYELLRQARTRDEEHFSERTLTDGLHLRVGAPLLALMTAAVVVDVVVVAQGGVLERHSADGSIVVAVTLRRR